MLKKEKRTHLIKIRVTEKEFKIINKSKNKTFYNSISAFLRAIILKSLPKEVNKDLVKLKKDNYFLLLNISNNINQIALRLNKNQGSKNLLKKELDLLRSITKFLENIKL